MELIWLEDFIELARTGNFSRAAEVRHVTQPAFSRRIRALEDWVGVTLFDRQVPPVTLTAAGQAFQPMVAELIRGIAEARARVRDVAAAETATVRFAATHALSQIFFPGWLSRLEAGEDTRWMVHLTSDSLAAVEALFVEGRDHFLLCHAHAGVPLPLPPERFLSAVVGHDELRACAAPALAAGLGPGAEAAEGTGTALSQQAPLLAYGANSGIGRILRGVLGDRLPRLSGAPEMTADLAGTLRAICLAGRGVAWLPRSLVAEDLAQRRLVPVGEAGWRVPVDIALFRLRTELPPAAEAFWQAAQRAGG